jgi:hypothetical protein
MNLSSGVRAIVLLSLMGAGIFGVTSKSEAQNYKRYRRTKQVVFDNCSIIEGYSRISIKGGYLQLPENKKLGVVKLPAKYRFFACEGNVLTAKVKISDTPIQLNITLDQFGKKRETAEAGGSGLGGQCKKTSGWPRGLIYKTLGSTHFDPGDRRRNTIGLVAAPGAAVSASGCTDMVDTQGNIVAQFGLYSTNDGWKFRAYSATGCGGSGETGTNVASEAQRNTKSTDVYVRFGDTCYGPIDPSQCIGSAQC